MRRVGLAFAFVLGLTVAAAEPAAALTFDFTTGGTGGTGLGNQIVFVSNEDPFRSVKIRAYSTGNTDGTGLFVESAVNRYSSGLGITSPGESTSSPHHTADNYGLDEYLLVEFDADNFKPTTLAMTWFSSDRDLSFWIGGSGPDLDLTTMTAAMLPANGFSSEQTRFDLQNTGNGGSSVVVGGGLMGRYLLIGPKLGYSNDYFKFAGLTADEPPGVEVAEPATILIFALGLAVIAVIALRKRDGLGELPGSTA